MSNFPAGFLWGCATAALQIEGSTQCDGRVDSIWDVFCRQNPDRIHAQATPERACDHYQRWSEDLDWIAKLGHNAYRFSIAWPRMPGGIDFYDRLIDGLCARGIQPMATLYHWDLPHPLGNWENPATLDAFLQYTQLCADRLGDRVSHWMTLNEPAWSVMNGYVTGLHPPAVHDLKRAFTAAHGQLQAHHLALAELRRQRVVGKLGIALNLSPVKCAGDTRRDRRAARWADDYLNRWFLEGVVHGAYPERAWRLLQHTLDFDKQLTHPQPLDFLGVNYYYPKWVAHSQLPTRFHLNTSGNAHDKCQFSLQGRLRFCDPPQTRKTEWDWEIDPEGLENLLVQLHHSYPGLPLVVTENGIGLGESWSDQSLQDSQRIEFVAAHLRAIQKAIAAGAPVQGYLMWSLMDNFSWLNGYHKRYGLLAIHPETLERRPKASAEWFRQVFCDQLSL
ncbi:family 1 glycosylhydrolase [bacterium]|nr:family 1 glycosylhydrolase [bacterium]